MHVSSICMCQVYACVNYILVSKPLNQNLLGNGACPAIAVMIFNLVAMTRDVHPNLVLGMQISSLVVSVRSLLADYILVLYVEW